MLSRRIAAAAAALGALMMQPAQAGPLGFDPSVQAGGGHIQPVFHEPSFGFYRAPRGYVEPPRFAPALLPPGQIERLLYRSGYSDVEIVALEGPIYTVQGIDPWDNYVEMKVFGEDGRVLRSDPIEARLYDTPFAAPPPAAMPGRIYPPDDGPRIVGAIPQAPPALAGRSEPRLATAPLPRERPAYRAEPRLPDAESSDPAAEPAEPAPAPGERDPLVVY